MLLMGKSTISMAIFNSYVKLPEGKWIEIVDFPIKNGGSFHSFMLVHQRLPTKSIVATPLVYHLHPFESPCLRRHVLDSGGRHR